MNAIKQAGIMMSPKVKENAKIRIDNAWPTFLLLFMLNMLLANTH